MSKTPKSSKVAGGPGPKKPKPRGKLTRTSNVAGGPGPVKPKPTTPK